MHDVQYARHCVVRFQGLPAVSIASSEFREAAEAQRDALGMKDATLSAGRTPDPGCDGR